MDLNLPPPPESPSDYQDYADYYNHPTSPQQGGDHEPTPAVAALDGGGGDPTSPVATQCGGDNGGSDIDLNTCDNNGGDDDDDDGYWGGFSENYRAYPLSHIEKTHLEAGNKIILPLSALDQLMRIGVGFPMLFQLKNPNNNRTSHCGVLEFTGEEGMAFMPDWMIKNVSLEEQGGLVNIKNVNLETATYVKLQPHSVEFLDIRSPKDVLEASFCLGYSCLTVGDTIVIMHDNKKLFVDIVDAKPSNAVCIIDTDCKVDFAPPLDYKEPKKKAIEDPKLSKEKEEKEEEDRQKFVPFSGKGRRLVEETSNLVACDMDVDVADHGSGKRCKATNKIVFDGSVINSTSSRLMKPMGGESVEVPNSVAKSLKPFTGKKYSLMD